MKSQSAGIVARAKTALKADPSTSTAASTGVAGKKEKKSSSVTQSLEIEERTSRKPSSSAVLNKATTSPLARPSPAQSVAPARSALSKKLTDGKKVSIAEVEKEIIGEVEPTDKNIAESLPIDDSSNSRVKRSGPSVTRQAAASGGSSLVAVRKKQLHEQQAKSSPISTVVNREKRVSVKNLDTAQKSVKKPSLSTSLTDRVVKASTEKLDKLIKVAESQQQQQQVASKAKKPSVPATSIDRHLVKASTEKLETGNKRTSLKSAEAVAQKPKVSVAAVSEEKITATAAAEKKLSVATEEKASTPEKLDAPKEEVRRKSQDKGEVVKEEKSPKSITKKSSSINVFLSVQQQKEQIEALRKESIKKKSSIAESPIEEVEDVPSEPIKKKSSPLLGAVLDNPGSGDNLSTHVNLSSTSSLDTDQVINDGYFIF